MTREEFVTAWRCATRTGRARVWQGLATVVAWEARAERCQREPCMPSGV